MQEKKMFQKKSLNSDDYKSMVQGAKAVKGILGSIGAIVLIAVNKDNIKVLGSRVLDTAKRVVKK